MLVAGNLDPRRVLRTARIALLAMIALLACVSVPAQQPDIYPPPEQAAGDLAAALKQAATGHRRVILDFGGNWCPDCHVLDTYFHDAANKPILDANYILVHINIGQEDRNLDIADRYQIPLKKGVPALAVLNSKGELLYSQKGGEFEAMRRMDSSAVTRFLVQWKPGKA